MSDMFRKASIKFLDRSPDISYEQEMETIPAFLKDPERILDLVLTRSGCGAKRIPESRSHTAQT